MKTAIVPFRSWIVSSETKRANKPGNVQTAFHKYAALRPEKRSGSVCDILINKGLSTNEAAVTACMMNPCDLARGIADIGLSDKTTCIVDILSSEAMPGDALEHIFSLMGAQTSKALLSYAGNTMQATHLRSSFPFGKTWNPQLSRDLTDHVRTAERFLESFDHGKNPDASFRVHTNYGGDNYNLDMSLYDVTMTLNMIRRIAASEGSKGRQMDRAWATAIGNLPTVRALGYIAMSPLTVKDTLGIVDFLSGKA